MDESGDLALLVAADIPCLDGQFSYVPTAAGDQLPLISVQQEQTLQDLSVEHTPAAEASLPIPERGGPIEQQQATIQTLINSRVHYQKDQLETNIGELR